MERKHSFITRFSRFAGERVLFRPGDRLVLAVSGGVDSTVMLDAFCEIQESWGLELSVAHINHQLRGDESDGDEAFVRDAARRYHLPVFCKRADVVGLAHEKGISKQEAAREIRYAYFEEIRQQTCAGHIATAHHADDNAETVLLNILRGTGVRGMAGIPVTRDAGQIVRPMLFATREEILAYATERQLAYRNDSSNDSTIYTRNYLRHKVFPLLEQEFGPGMRESLSRLSETMREFSGYLDRIVDERAGATVSFRSDGCTLSIPALAKEPGFIQEEVILRVLRRLNVESTRARIREILEFCRHQTGQSLKVSERMTVQKNREELVFAPVDAGGKIHETIRVGDSFTGPGFTLSVGTPEPVPAV
ncbi:MAG TPA: tRNA lysidine(34) synthetase TilS, partial [Bacteroidota bacterium]|nr:tRNA lysidine(34) synthetase TilS [Bacteroidota bacterium]